MASKLNLYNSAALILGERKLSSLSENVVMRRRLDTAYDDGFVESCLSRGFWNFAMRVVRMDYSPSVEPDFGYRRAFDKPTDWVHTGIVASDEFFNNALTRYDDTSAYWFADLDVLYVKYVSDGADYGLDFANWPANFSAFCAHELALKVAMSTTGSTTDVEKLEAKVKRLLLKARSTDAMDEPTKFQHRGSWASARVGCNRER
jgi:hypothetical protein